MLIIFLVTWVSKRVSRLKGLAVRISLFFYNPGEGCCQSHLDFIATTKYKFLLVLKLQHENIKLDLLDHSISFYLNLRLIRFKSLLNYSIYVEKLKKCHIAENETNFACVMKYFSFEAKLK